MKIKSLLSVALVVAASGSAISYFMTQSAEQQKTESPAHHQRQTEHLVAAASTTQPREMITRLKPVSSISSTVTSLVAVQTGGQDIQQEVPAYTENEVIWETSEHELAGDLYPEEIEQTDYQVLHMDEPFELSLSVGDTVSIPLPGTDNVTATVTAERLEDNGDYTWEGNIKTETGSFPVVMTQGQHGTYGSIATDEGTYTVTTIEGQLVVYKNPPLPEGHGEDFLVPKFFS